MIAGIGFLCACSVALSGGWYAPIESMDGIGAPVGRVNVAMGLLALLAFAMVWVGGALPFCDEWDLSVREAAKGVD